MSGWVKASKLGAWQHSHNAYQHGLPALKYAPLNDGPYSGPEESAEILEFSTITRDLGRAYYPISYAERRAFFPLEYRGNHYGTLDQQQGDSVAWQKSGPSGSNPETPAVLSIFAFTGNMELLLSMSHIADENQCVHLFLHWLTCEKLVDAQ